MEKSLPIILVGLTLYAVIMFAAVAINRKRNRKKKDED